MGVRLSSGLVTITAVGGGNNVVLGAVAANPTAWTLSPGKRAVIKKVAWRNGIGVNANLLIGYGDRTVAGSVFRQVFPNILMVNGFDGELREEDLPIMGNGVGYAGVGGTGGTEGFVADTTPVTGTTGAIIVETDGAAGAYPANVQVIIEVEEE